MRWKVILKNRHQLTEAKWHSRLLPTIAFKDDGDVVLDKGADVEQHGWLVDGAETELNVIRRVIVAKAEVVVVRVDPVGPCCLI